MSVRTDDGIAHEAVTVTQGTLNRGKPYLVAFCDIMLTLDDPVVARSYRAGERFWQLDDITHAPVTCLMCMGEPES